MIYNDNPGRIAMYCIAPHCIHSGDCVRHNTLIRMMRGEVKGEFIVNNVRITDREITDCPEYMMPDEIKAPAPDCPHDDNLPF